MCITNEMILAMELSGVKSWKMYHKDPRLLPLSILLWDSVSSELRSSLDRNGTLGPQIAIQACVLSRLLLSTE